MHIAARLAVQSPLSIERAPAPVSPTSSFHGRNIVVRALSERGFEADCPDDYPVGALVRLRLPGAGAALARITDAGAGRLCADFVNPVGMSRLAMALGTRSALIPA